MAPGRGGETPFDALQSETPERPRRRAAPPPLSCDDRTARATSHVPLGRRYLPTRLTSDEICVKKKDHTHKAVSFGVGTLCGSASGLGRAATGRARGPRPVRGLQTHPTFPVHRVPWARAPCLRSLQPLSLRYSTHYSLLLCSLFYTTLQHLASEQDLGQPVRHHRLGLVRAHVREDEQPAAARRHRREHRGLHEPLEQHRLSAG